MSNVKTPNEAEYKLRTLIRAVFYSTSGNNTRFNPKLIHKFFYKLKFNESFSQQFPEIKLLSFNTFTSYPTSELIETILQEDLSQFVPISMSNPTFKEFKLHEGGINDYNSFAHTISEAQKTELNKTVANFKSLLALPN